MDQAKQANTAPYDQILGYFKYSHLPEHLQEVSRDFSELAYQMACRGGDIAETKAGIRKLLEAKDCAVRAMIR